LRQDKSHAETINALVCTVESLAALVPDDKLDAELRDDIAHARRFKVLEEIIDIDLADPHLMAQAGLATASEQSGGFRDFSAAAIQRRHDAGHKLARLRLQKLFEEHGLLPASH
jgi:hypothetical protein